MSEQAKVIKFSVFPVGFGGPDDRLDDTYAVSDMGHSVVLTNTRTGRKESTSKRALRNAEWSELASPKPAQTS